MSGEITWSHEAEARLNRAPVFLRPTVRNITEKKAREAGVAIISEAFLAGVRDALMTGGQKPVPAVKESGKKTIVWTGEAEARLAGAPDLLRGMLKKIVEEIAVERGHLEVNCKLFDEVEALGASGPEASRPHMQWNQEAERMLDARLAGTPELAVEFMRELLRADAEELARERGQEIVSVELLSRLQKIRPTPVPWAKDARVRLDDAPNFVRSGIKRAAERRARREGLEEISSADLTRFRNEAMMKAVRRLRALGFTELTFDGVFEVASGRVKRLADNAQAARRFDEIRDYVEGRADGVGLLDQDMVQAMRDYLKDASNKSP